MKNILLTLCLSLISIWLIASPASAHVLESSGSIGAVLHVTPDDDPVAGEPSSFYFDFKDKTGQFKAQDCRCRLVVEQNSEIIYNELFNQPSGSTFTFPARGIYIVKAVGEPLKTGVFAKFSLSYTIRVERGADIIAQPPFSANANLPFLVIGTFAFFFVFVIIRYKIVHRVK